MHNWLEQCTLMGGKNTSNKMSKLTKEQAKKSKTFCMIPWTHIHTWPDGRVLSCCMVEENAPIGSLKENTLEELWNAPKQKKLRADLMNGKASKDCKRCYTLEKHTLNSPRITANNEFLDKHWPTVGTTKDDGSHDLKNLPYWDFRFSNLCNFKCRTCGPSLSSAWYEDQVKIWGPQKEAKIIRPYKNEDKFWNTLEPYIDDVEVIYFAGGEPLIMEEHYRIIKRLVEKKMFHVKLKYNTNFSIMKFKDIDIMKEWDKFEYVYIGASLDAAGPRGEYLRKGQDWAQVEMNRNRMFEVCPRAEFFLATCLDIFNSFHVPDFHIDWTQRGYIKEGGSLINPLLTPDYLRIDCLTNELKDKLAEKYVKSDKWMLQNTDVKSTQYKGLIDFLYAEDRRYDLKRWLRYTNQLDALRNEDWRQVFPELVDLEGYAKTL